MKRALRHLQRGMFQLAALSCLLLGLIGAFVPLLPTTPFVLLALWLAMRSSPRLTAWIRNHPRFGPMLRDWHTHGVISLRAKQIATASILLSAVLIALSVSAWMPKLLAWSVLAVVTAFIWSRPSRSLSDSGLFYCGKADGAS